MQFLKTDTSNPRESALAFMTGLNARVGQIGAAEGYLLELISYIAFGRGVLPETEDDKARTRS